MNLPLGAFGTKVRVHITKYSGAPKLQVKFNYNWFKNWSYKWYFMYDIFDNLNFVNDLHVKSQ